MIKTYELRLGIGENPCGKDIRESFYGEISELRKQDETDLDFGVWERELKTANWQKIIEISEDILKTKSKDLFVSFWLLEALTYSSGLSGMLEGLENILIMIETFGKKLFPIEDESKKIGIDWLDKHIPIAIFKILKEYYFFEWSKIEHNDANNSKNKYLDVFYDISPLVIKENLANSKKIREKLLTINNFFYDKYKTSACELTKIIDKLCFFWEEAENLQKKTRKEEEKVIEKPIVEEKKERKGPQIAFGTKDDNRHNKSDNISKLEKIAGLSEEKLEKLMKLIDLL